MPGVVHFFTGLAFQTKTLFSNVFGHRKRNFLKVLKSFRKLPHIVVWIAKNEPPKTKLFESAYKPFCKLPRIVVWVAKNELVDATTSSSTTATAATTV